MNSAALNRVFAMALGVAVCLAPGVGSGDDESECMGGWLAQGLTWNPDSPADRFNGYVSNNDRANEYQLNQLYAFLNREADQASDAIAFGFRADLMVGTDAYSFQALGLDDKIISDSDSRFYKLAFPQLYADCVLPVGNGVRVIAGRWYALVGYETGLATQDQFYSRSLGFNLSPNTHTGVLLQSQLSDQWEFQLGLHNGWDVFVDNNNDLGVTTSLAWTSEDEASQLYFAMTLSPEQDETAVWQDIDGVPGADSPGEDLNRLVYSIALDHELTDDISIAINHDGFFQEGSDVYGIDQAEAYGVTGWLLYEHSETLSMGLRGEVLRDDDGYVSSGFRSLNAASPGVYTNLTAGLNWQVCSHTVVRPEVRWDWQDRDDPADVPAFDDGTEDDQFLLAFDLVTRL